MRHRKVFAVLPTLLTLGNAACGFGSITFAAKVGPETLDGNQLFVAALLLFLAMVFDMLDGSVARLTKQTSEFGGQLDSLCDAISFGVAPAFLMIQFVRHDHTFGGILALPFTYPPRFLWVIGVLFVVCALLRLARFNVETDEDDSHEYFSGLPSPLAAGVVASFPIALHGLADLMVEEAETGPRLFAEWVIPVMKVTLPLITFAVACLMVSRVRYAHIFNQLFRGQRSRRHMIQLVFAGAAVYLVREMALLVIFCTFAFAAPVRAFAKELATNFTHWMRSSERRKQKRDSTAA